MKLRLKLMITLVALVVPLAFFVGWFTHRSAERSVGEGTAETIIQRMEQGERWACEESAETWPRVHRRGGRRRGPPPRRRGRPQEIFAYDASFQSDNPDAPAFPPALRNDLEHGEVFSLVRDRAAGADRRLVAVKMPWDDGPCAVVLVRRGGAPDHGPMRAVLPALAVSAATLFIAFLAAGPIVRRIRRLTDGVERGEAIDLRGHDEIAELANAFEARRRRIDEQVTELEKRDEALRSYVANTTHDVMLPVTVLQGHLAALERSAEAGETIDASRITAALEECQYLTSLMQNLSAAAKLDAGEPHVMTHDVDLGGVVERVIGRHRPFARSRKVSLDHAVPEVPIAVRGDVTMIEQAVNNLVHNAIRYNKVGGRVAVTLDATDDEFVLRVLDDGPGVDESELGKLVERGYRGGRARTRDPHGMGLGLSIVRDVAARHGMSLTLERPEDGGLSATLRGATDRPQRV